jgi:hypothetical protein
MMCEFGNRQVLVKPAGGDQRTAILALRLDEQGVCGNESMQESLGLNWSHISNLSGSVVSGWSLLHSNSLLLRRCRVRSRLAYKSVASPRRPAVYANSATEGSSPGCANEQLSTVCARQMGDHQSRNSSSNRQPAFRQTCGAVTLSSQMRGRQSHYLTCRQNRFAKSSPEKETILTVSHNNSRNDTCITHLGVTYSITQFAHQSETPLETCPCCAGTGQMYTRKCRNCNGRGLTVNGKQETGRNAGR